MIRYPNVFRPLKFWKNPPNSSLNSSLAINFHYSTIWLFNIAMERSTIFKKGKPSISMGHGLSMAMLVITRW
jgi:hypothetical protein